MSRFDWRRLTRVSVPCPLCGSDDFRLYHRYGDVHQYRLVRCRRCRFIWQNPRFAYDDEFLKWAYSSYGDPFLDGVAQTAAPEELIRNDQGYFEWKKRLLDRFVNARPYRLMDVGAACGQFLLYCRGHGGCVVTAVETSPRQCEYIRERLGMDVVQGTPETVAGRAGAYDAVHIAHTLEHMPDPKATGETLTRLLRPGGVLFVEVPNVVSFKNSSDRLRSALGIRRNSWSEGDFPEHLVEFSGPTLKRLMRLLKLEIVYFRTHSRSVLRKRPALKALDFGLNAILPIGNNLVCLGRKSAT
jgi:SAM-dependent methyltransferase